MRPDKPRAKSLPGSSLQTFHIFPSLLPIQLVRYSLYTGKLHRRESSLTRKIMSKYSLALAIQGVPHPSWNGLTEKMLPSRYIITSRSYTRCRQISESRARISRKLSLRGENLRRSIRPEVGGDGEEDDDEEEEIDADDAVDPRRCRGGDKGNTVGGAGR